MIRMLRRSVTRFFIPLIDVLLLFFIIFLLLPYARTQSDQDQRSKIEAEQAEQIDGLERKITELSTKLNQLEDLRPGLAELEKLRQEIERLQKLNKTSLQARTAFHIIDIDPKSGAISWYDGARPDQPIFKNPEESVAHFLIDKHLKEAAGKELYYYSMYPRTDSGYPTLRQERDYRRWFDKAANSLKEPLP